MMSSIIDNDNSRLNFSQNDFMSNNNENIQTIQVEEYHNDINNINIGGISNGLGRMKANHKSEIQINDSNNFKKHNFSYGAES